MSDETKHAPGPWDTRDLGSPDRVLILDQAGGLVAMAYWHGSDTDANARLIAAAPELAEALGFCVRALEVATTPLPRDREEVRAAQLRARSALEKAGLR